jgi:hypothetical protein
VLVAFALFSPAHADAACEGPTPEQAAVVLSSAQDRYHAAKSVYLETEWQYKLAIEDRDTVLAEKKTATNEMKDAKDDLKAAKRASKEAESRVADCGPQAPAAA